MALSKISVFLACVLIGLALVLPSHAQTSQDYLNAHNTARHAVQGANIPDLVYDTSLEASVQAYLNTKLGQCSLIVDLSTSGINIKVQQNILTGLDTLNSWVSESIYYDYGTNSCVGGVCTHYTQVVWSSSVRLGCVKSQCLNDLGLQIVGCQYDPAGNVLGQRPYTL